MATTQVATALRSIGGGSRIARGRRGRRGDRNGEGKRPTRKWNQDIDARGHDQFDLCSIEVNHVYTAARKADVIVWKDVEGVFHADSASGTVASGEDVIEVTQAAVDSLTDDRDWKERVAVVSPSTVGPVSADEEVPEVQYVVDNPRADLGEPAGDDGGELTELKEGIFRIGPEGSDDLILEAADGETETGTDLVLSTWEDAEHQRFEAVPRAPELYTLEPTHADLAVDVWEIDPEPGADLRHWSPSGSNNQLWTFQDPDD